MVTASCDDASRDEQQVLAEIIRLVRRSAATKFHREDAEDLAQNVAFWCWTRMQQGKWRIDVSLEAFINCLVTRRALEAVRERGRREVRYAEHARELEASSHAWMNPELALEEAEQEAFYARTLAELPAAARRAYAMVREESLTYQDVAERIGVSRATVCAHVVTAQRHFRAGLRAQGVDLSRPVRTVRRRSAVAAAGERAPRAAVPTCREESAN